MVGRLDVQSLMSEYSVCCRIHAKDAALWVLVTQTVLACADVLVCLGSYYLVEWTVWTENPGAIVWVPWFLGVLLLMLNVTFVILLRLSLKLELYGLAVADAVWLAVNAVGRLLSVALLFVLISGNQDQLKQQQFWMIMAVLDLLLAGVLQLFCCYVMCVCARYFRRRAVQQVRVQAADVATKICVQYLVDADSLLELRPGSFQFPPSYYERALRAEIANSSDEQVRNCAHLLPPYQSRQQYQQQQQQQQQQQKSQK